LADLGALGGVVEVGQAGVVELQVGTAQGAQPLDLVGVGGGQVGPKALHVRVHHGVHRGGAAAVVHHVRRRDGELGHGRADVVAQEDECVGEDRVHDAKLAVDVDGGRGELDIPGGVVELYGQVAGGLGYAAQGVDEVHVPGRAAELAIGGRLQADLLLHLDRGGNHLVLDRRQVSGADPA